jgi:hypothetical protein
MTTWAEVSDESTTYGIPADIYDRYVVVGYAGNDYILPEQVWSAATASGTSWA